MEKEEARKFFINGFASARKGAFTSNDLGPVTSRTAEKMFERWWSRNQ